MSDFIVRPLKWYKPTDHPQDREDDALMARGLGGRYSISRKQTVGAPYLLWHADDEFYWTGHQSIDDAKAVAQSLFDAAVRAYVVSEPSP